MSPEHASHPGSIAWGLAESGAGSGKRLPGRRGCRAWIALGAVGFLAVPFSSPIEAQVVRGRILSTSGGAPLSQASVTLVDSLGNPLESTVTGASGVFRFELGPGRESVYIQGQALGYLTFFDGPIPLDGATPVEVELRLEPVPLQLDSLSVTVEGRSRSLEEYGFYVRERLGTGFHLDRSVIQQRVSALNLDDLLRTVPGVSVGNRGQVTFQGVRSLQGCTPNVYLDGALVVSAASPDPGWARNLIDPLDVDGIEIYRRPSEVPVQYSASGACGVILIWSRR